MPGVDREIIEIHGGRDKTVKESHDDAGDGGQRNALAAVALSRRPTGGPRPFR